MRGLETEPFVKSFGVHAEFVAGQLREMAAARLGAGDGPIQKSGAHAAAAKAGFDPDVFDQSAPAAQKEQAWNVGQLQDADDFIADLGDDQLTVFIVLDSLKGLMVSGRQRLLVAVPLVSEGVINQHADNGGKVVAGGEAEGERRIAHGRSDFSRRYHFDFGVSTMPTGRLSANPEPRNVLNLT